MVKALLKSFHVFYIPQEKEAAYLLHYRGTTGVHTVTQLKQTFRKKLNENAKHSRYNINGNDILKCYRYGSYKQMNEQNMTGRDIWSGIHTVSQFKQSLKCLNENIEI